MVALNINSYVRIKLTDYGLEILRSNHERISDQTTPNMIQRIIGIFERKPLISKEI